MIPTTNPYCARLIEVAHSTVDALPDTDVVAAFLFGSAAWGDADAASDLDIMILLDRPAGYCEAHFVRGYCTYLVTPSCRKDTRSIWIYKGTRATLTGGARFRYIPHPSDRITRAMKGTVAHERGPTESRGRWERGDPLVSEQAP